MSEIFFFNKEIKLVLSSVYFEFDWIYLNWFSWFKDSPLEHFIDVNIPILVFVT